MLPFRSITPTWSTFSSVNQKVPSGIAVMSHGCAFGVGRSYSVIVPVGVIFAIRFAKRSVNQRLPSLPSVMP